MKPVLWLLLAEIMFFIIAAINIAHGILYFIDPTNLSYVVLFGMLLVWYLDKYITYIFVVNKVTPEDLLRDPK